MKHTVSRRYLFYAVFFFSGAAGLAYEIVWARQLSLLLGVSLYAVTAVLVAFMGGLGIGAEYFGRKLDKGTDPVRLYAFLEIGLGVYVLLFPLWLKIVEKIYLFLHPGYEGVSAYVLALRFVLAVIVLLLPTSLMGGTLPAMARYFANYEKESSRFTGRLYAINTLGAMVGCIAAGFWMIEHFGLSGTLRVGAAVNILAGIVVFGIARKSVPVPQKSSLRSSSAPELPIMDKTLLIMFGISGFCALGLELLWTRLLVLVLNNTTYAFALILAVFLLGIAAGSAVTARLTARTLKDGARFFALFQVGVGFFAILSLLGFARNSGLISLVGSILGPHNLFTKIIPGGEQLAAPVFFTILIIFPCTFLMGGGLPLVVKAVASGREKLGGDIGRLYAVNTLGAVLGTVITGYAFIPLFGIQKSLLGLAWLAVASGMYLLWKRSMENRARATFFTVPFLLALTVFFVFRGDISMLLSAQKLDAGSRIVFYEEGPYATVLVSRQESDFSIGRKPLKRLWINGDPIAGAFREALQLERLQAHIPLLLIPNPKTGLVICFGTGSTAGAALTHGLESLTAVDTSREVFDAGPKFAPDNLGVMENPKVTFVEEDGRNFLLTTKRKFDFISAEPPPPSNAGIVSLYTKEFYELCRKRLTEGGITTQWIPLHHLSREDFRMLVSAFLDIFPHAAMWYTKWDAIMMGSDKEIEIDIEKIREGMKNPKVAESLKGIGVMNAYQLLSNFMMDSRSLAKFVKDTPPLEDDRPVVEFSAPRLGIRKGVRVKEKNLTALLVYRTFPEIKSASPEEKKICRKYFDSQTAFFKGQVERSAGHAVKASRYYAAALELNADNNDARYNYIRLNVLVLDNLLAQNRIQAGLDGLRETVKLDTQGWFKPQLHFMRGMFLASAGRARAAAVEFESAIGLDDGYFLAKVNLAGLYRTKLDRPGRAIDLYWEALKLNPTEDERSAIIKALKELGENVDNAMAESAEAVPVV